MTTRLELTPLRSLAALSLALASCGDSVATSATDPQGSSTSSTSDPTTTTADPPTTSTTGDDSSGGMTGAASTTTTGTTDAPTTGTSTTEAVSASETGTSSDTTTTTGDASTSTGDTTTTTGDTSTGDTSSTGDTEGPPKSCLAGEFPVTAALCGDGGPACATLRDELVSAAQKFRNDMPAIALGGDCEPAVLYSEAVGGYHGFLAEREGPDTWAVEPTPMAIATGALEPDPDVDALQAIVDDGAFGVSLWRREDGLWAQQSALVGQNHVRAPQLVRDAQGALHVGHIDGAQAAYHEVFDGSWSKEQVLTSADIHVRLALDADAAARLIAWSSQDATWKLHFMAPPGVPEVVSPLGSNVLERPSTGLALVGPEATPWVLLARKQADQQHHDVVLAHRTGPATWALETLAAEDPPGDETCDAPPVQEGQQCAYDYTRLYPLTLLASATELRALYLAIRHQGTLVAQCEPLPFPTCFWAGQADASTSELRVAWPGSTPEEHAVVATDVFTDRATGRLDTAGEIHLAFYDRPPGALDPVVRYLLIGP